jgi:Fe-S-cluster containining protein
MQCIHFVTTEIQCKSDATDGNERCRKHHAAHLKREEKAGPVREGGCSAILTKGTRCTHYAVQDTLCSRHADVKRKHVLMIERRREEDRVIEQRTAAYINGDIAWRLALQLLLIEWRDALVTARVFWQVAEKVTIGQGSTIAEMETFYDQIRFMRILPFEQLEAETIKPMSDLQKLATDTQNVHTKEVSSFTEKLTSLLLAQNVPEDQRTLQRIVGKFSKLCKIDRMNDLLEVLNDINKWYEMSTCIRADDWLYKKLLDAAVCKIEASEFRNALYKRAYEEAKESVGMCCQGHLSRIINIFSGFDSEFTSPVSAKELLQEKISSIAASDASYEDKIKEANIAFVDLNIPKQEWSDWIDAL